MRPSDGNPYHSKNHRTVWWNGFCAYLRHVLKIANPYHVVWVRGQIHRMAGALGYRRAWDAGWQYAKENYTLSGTPRISQ